MNEILTINPKFEQIIPPLSAEEFAQLEENILSEGMVIHPIVVWKNTIVDGHNRYKIVQKHPEIAYSTFEKNFNNEYEVISWICSNQLGRRNITEPYKKCLLATRYEAEKLLSGFNGNKYTNSNESRVDTACPPYKTHGTRSRLAEEAGVSEGYIEKAVQYMKGVNAADEIEPGIKNEIMAGLLTPTCKEIIEIGKLPMEKRKNAVDMLRTPKEKRKEKEIARQIEEAFANGTEQETEQETEEETPQEKEVVASIPESTPKPKSAETDEKEDNKTEKREIEESILNSMIGAVNMFIDSINNYLSRFPRLRTDPKYRSQTREIMVAARDYINDVEGDLL